MSDDDHIAQLKKGVTAWNAWRDENTEVRVDLRMAILDGADLKSANLKDANLSGADLSGANLVGANLSRAYLSGANLSRANLSGATLSGGTLLAARLVETDLTCADLTGCNVYGVSAWNLKLEGTKQQDLVITPPEESTVTVDDIEVAQFVYLLLHNEKIRDVIDTITSKAVDRKSVV